ncbi:hypothetical protein M422DRAFT_61514 [Sphaerobolus stellatus SS14]|uniref:Translation initiation factor eIF2B subunit delta n=1 Tax=Sphaerobolus stellatus (strain SS14) TaxID=990650 RepID=A0A0C9UU59_SPHS4|nr:hypothetical protein M422DRAFT_61514 [Sphaerobolus stellatus SS14]
MATAETSRGLKVPPKTPLSKAERRAKQEKDRAAKEATKAQDGGKNAAKGSASKGPRPVVLRDLPPAITTHEIAAQQTRGLRIFSHFGLIRNYETPPDQAMSRDLTTYLNPQINHLVSSRPMAVSMGNAIRYLEVEISVLEPSLPEQDVLLHGHAHGKQFSVIVVDSRRLLEGKQLLSKLADAGIECTYLLLTALGSAIQDISLVLLGAHSVQSDGAVYSRAGTALAAMIAKSHSVPTHFSDAVHLDSFSKNELGESRHHTPDPEQLALTEQLNLRVLNPLYDLISPSNITAIVTEVGTIPPNSVCSLPGSLDRDVST